MIALFYFHKRSRVFEQKKMTCYFQEKAMFSVTVKKPLKKNKAERKIFERKLVDKHKPYAKNLMITPSFLIFAIRFLFTSVKTFAPSISLSSDYISSIFLDTWAHGLSPFSQETTLGRDRTKLTVERLLL